jgi:hypothetical protein
MQAEDLAFISPESEATISTYLPLSPKELQATSDELRVTNKELKNSLLKTQNSSPISISPRR